MNANALLLWHASWESHSASFETGVPLPTESLSELYLDCLEDTVLLEQADRYCSNLMDEHNGSLKPLRQLRQVQKICLFNSGLHGCND